MAQRTDTELRVFLEGTLAQYNALTDKTGTVFFDKDNHAVYAKGECIIQSNIKDVTYNATSTELTITPFTGTPIVINLGIQSELEGLKTTLETWVGNNYVAKVTFDIEINKKVDKEKGKGLSTNDYTTADKSKLDGIEEGAQKNRLITVNDNRLGNDEQTSAIKISGNLISLPNNGEDGEMAVNLYAEYSSTDKKIYFRNGDTEDASNLFTIDTTDFVRDGMVSGVTYDATNKNLVITFNTDSGKEAITVSLASLVDTYTAGDGITLAGNKFSANLGNGLQFDSTNPKKITLKPTANGGIKVDGNGVALQVVTNGGITVGANGAAVDWTKAPVLSVNGQTGAVTIDVTPKVWKFEN